MRRIYFTLNRIESVNLLMENRSSLCPRTEQCKVIRTLSKTIPLYDRCVTGLKITIDRSNHTEKLNELDLRNRFGSVGKILHCQWMNDEKTEALFTFAEYKDSTLLYIRIFFPFQL